MKTEPRHFRLRDEIRNCFPQWIRDELEIRSITVCHNDDAAVTKVRVMLRDADIAYDDLALQTLLDADDVVVERSQTVIRGIYAGRRCEVQLVASPLLTHA